jgi:hypothetical protein
VGIIRQALLHLKLRAGFVSSQVPNRLIHFVAPMLLRNPIAESLQRQRFRTEALAIKTVLRNFAGQKSLPLLLPFFASSIYKNTVKKATAFYQNKKPVTFGQAFHKSYRSFFNLPQ